MLGKPLPTEPHSNPCLLFTQIAVASRKGNVISLIIPLVSSAAAAQDGDLWLLFSQ